jgi:acetolactate synthase-1/2/3 large subunit
MVRDGGATVIFQWTYSQSEPCGVIWKQIFGRLGRDWRIRSALRLPR